MSAGLPVAGSFQYPGGAALPLSVAAGIQASTSPVWSAG